MSLSTPISQLSYFCFRFALITNDKEVTTNTTYSTCKCYLPVTSLFAPLCIIIQHKFDLFSINLDTLFPAKEHLKD